MCGIAGFYADNELVDKLQLVGMTNALAHRGPDASGYYYGKKVKLGHRRLSIVDLSAEANQPMYSQSGQTVVVFNGEIYNYAEVAAQLGINLKTKSDTEIIAEAFERIGPRFVELLNGMFAIAICDIATQTLYLFRDRMGIKPLFYFYADGVFAFASELKSIEKLSVFQQNKSINKRAVNQFLQLGYIPAPNTIYNSVYKFPQGHYAVFDGKSVVLSNYWNISKIITDKPLATEGEALSTLQQLVESSVQYRLMADVPYGTLLSGGIDSSLVTAVARKMSGNKIDTFSIGFCDSAHDESFYAEQVARKLDTNHQLLVMTEQDAMERIADMFYYYDEPFADSSALPTMLVSQLAAKHVKMVLTGDGGDEQFMGYGMYRWASRLDNNAIRLIKRPLYEFSKHLNSRYQRIGKMFDWRKTDNLQAHIFSQEQYLFTAAEAAMFTNYNYGSAINFEFATGRQLSAAEKQAFFDYNFYLPDDLLVKVDRASMRYSLEARVPLLDYRIVEFTANLDERLKMKNGVAKYLLKQLLFKYLPKELFERPKWGFSVPLCQWLRTDLLYFAQKYLNKEIVEAAQMVDYDCVEQLLNAFYNQGIDYLYNRVWALICLHQWWKERFMQHNSAFLHN